MTLIAAIRCHEGAVLCADTMETVEGFRSPVHKIAPHDCGEYWLAVAGSGHSDLIDGFAELLRQTVETWEPQYDDRTISAALRAIARDFHEHEVALYPEDSPRDKLTNFVVCVKPKGVRGLSLWEIRGPVVTPIGDYALLGYGSTLYKYELKRLYEANNPKPSPRHYVTPPPPKRFNKVRALLLGIHLFALAKDTSTYIGGETDAIYVFNNGDMKPVHQQDIRLLEERVSGFNRTIADIVLACPDTTTTDEELREYLETFTMNVLSWRETLALHAAEQGMRTILAEPLCYVDPYLHIPSTSAINVNFTTGGVTIEPRDANNPTPFKRKKPGRKKRG